MEWRHRIRVFEETLRTSQPKLQDHINQVLDVEQRKVVDDTKAILRYRGIAGMRTTLDISWPPKDQIRVTVDPEEDGSETNRDEEEDDQGGHPPTNCRSRPRSPYRRARLAPCQWARAGNNEGRTYGF